MEWIKIKDRYPKDGQRVIFYFEVTGISIGKYFYREGYHCFCSPDGWLCDDVTHWMPLPDPPKLP